MFKYSIVLFFENKSEILAWFIIIFFRIRLSYIPKPLLPVEGVVINKHPRNLREQSKLPIMQN